MEGEGVLVVDWFGVILFAILLITSVAAWLNTKIILEEIDKIKKFIGMPEEKPTDIRTITDNNEEYNKTD